MESWVQSWRPRTVPMSFAICSFHLSKSTTPATRKWGQVIRSAAPVTQNHLTKPEDLMLQHAASLRKSAPGTSNMSDSCVSSTAPATRNSSLQILFKCPTPANAFATATKLSRFARFGKVPNPLPNPLRLPHKTMLQRPKVAWTCGVSSIFTSKFAWRRHNSVHFFAQIPKVLRAWCVWLPNLLRATTACTFSTCQCPKVFRTWCVLYILTWKCASRHSGVHFFISHLTRWLRTRRSSEPTSRPSLSLLWLFPPLLFHLSEVWLLNFLRTGSS